MIEANQKMPDNLEALFEQIQQSGDQQVDLKGSVNRYLEMKAREKGVPLHGSFELTPMCNLDCKMCYVHLTQDQMKGRELLKVNQWKGLIQQAVEAGMLDATLTGGECLTYPGFDEIYFFLQELGIKVSILTNGVLLGKERIELFKRFRSSVQVSLYGTSDDAYERVTGKRVFEKVIENIFMARDAGLKISIGITPSRYMGEEDERLIEFLKDKGIRFFVNANLYEARKETGRNLEDFDQSLEDYIRLRRYYMAHRDISISLDCDEENQTDFDGIGLKCGAGNSGFSIDWQGNMYACAMLPDISAQPLRDGFENAWKNIHMAAQRYPNPIECRGCTYERICTKCVAVHRDGALAGHANKRICQLAQLITQTV